VKKGLRRIAGCTALAVAGGLAAIAAGPGLGAINRPTVTVPTLPVTTPTVTLRSTPPPPRRRLRAAIRSVALVEAGIRQQRR
jgi:hypothetical protein